MVATRTWPYGTKRTCTIISLELHAPYYIVALQDKETPEEGYVCLYSRNHGIISTIQAGDTVIIEFKEGGPTGGYWDILE